MNMPLNKLGYSEKLLLYMIYKSDPINVNAIFSDETENFLNPMEPEYGSRLLLKLRVGRNNADNCYVTCNDRCYLMKKTTTKGLFDYYEYEYPAITDKMRYYFEVEKNGTKYCYNKNGVALTANPDYHFTVIPGFKTPNWAKGAIMYQIYVDRFYNGDKSNDVVNYEYMYLGRPALNVTNWYKPLSNEDTSNFYGGDLSGIIQKLDYLKDLGIDVIYLNPIFVSPSTHKYDAQDYDYVDPHYGVIVEDGGSPLSIDKPLNRYASMYIQRVTNVSNLEASNRLLCRLIEQAHSMGMKVIIDGVFNHCGAFNKWLDREGFYTGKEGFEPGAYRVKESPYHNYFRWYEMDNWPYNDAYDGWWGFDNHPKLNFEASPELYQYILSVGRKWVSPPFNADGWRLDVAADLGYSKEFNHKFWRDFRKVVKQANPDAIILAEFYGDPIDWLQGDQWDTIMNYDAFMEPITWFLTGMEKHSESFREDLLNNAGAFESAMRFHMSRMTMPTLLSAMNELSNHDHSRFLTRTNMTVGRLHTLGADRANMNVNYGVMFEGITFQMTWPGAPTIYYGDEAGLCGWTDPDNRRTYPWGREDKRLIDFHKKIIKIRKSQKVLLTGSLEYLLLDYAAISYARFGNDGILVVVLNNDGNERDLKIPVWRVGVGESARMESLINTDMHNFYTTTVSYNVKNGYLKIKMPPYSSVLLAPVANAPRSGLHNYDALNDILNHKTASEK